MASMEAIEVRPATVEDAAALAALRWEWRSGEGRHLELDRADFVGRFGVWMTEHPAHHPFLAWSGSRPVGMAWLVVIERLPGPDRWTRRSGSVQSVYVTPAERGAGAGAALVRALVGRAAELGLDYLTVHPTPRATSLYRRLGFAVWEGVLELDINATRMDLA